MTAEERVMIATLQGILAKTSATQIFIDPEYGGYSTWLSYLNSEHGVGYEYVSGPWVILNNFKSDIDDYILYKDGDSSINAATSLAGIKNAIAVEKTIESKVQSYGLSCLIDVRFRNEAWVFDNYWNQLPHNIVIEQKEEFHNEMRDYAALGNVFTFYDGNSPFRDSVMTNLEGDSVCLGWGDASLGEDKFIGPSSDRGVFTLAADHARDLSTLSGITEPSLFQNTHIDPTLEENVHYVTFLMTDGDNIQWILGGFQSDSRWWGSPNRGNFNMGWGMSPSLIDLAPSVLKWYYGDASSGTYKDYFVVGPSGGGYMYPSRYPSAELDLHVQRLNDYMGRADLNIVQIIDFDSFNDTSLWDKYTAQPNIDGLFYLEYTLYNQHNGAIVWSNGKPVISAREMLWPGLSGCDENSVINHINSAPRDPYSASGYSLVMVLAWSKSLSDVQRVINGLDPDVRVVTPEAFVNLIAENVAH
jgi:hypothetical protein